MGTSTKERPPELCTSRLTATSCRHPSSPWQSQGMSSALAEAPRRRLGSPASPETVASRRDRPEGREKRAASGFFR